MIKANELRIGNYAALTEEAKEDFSNIIGEKINDYFDVTFFNSDGVDFDGFDFTFDELKPIPLTEEWLIRFGFEKFSQSEMYGEDFVDTHGWECEYKNGNLAMLKPSSRSNWGEKQNSFSVLGLSYVNLWIDYVHQLQNLYFALTNEELELVDTTEDSLKK